MRVSNFFFVGCTKDSYLYPRGDGGGGGGEEPVISCFSFTFSPKQSLATRPSLVKTALSIAVKL